MRKNVISSVVIHYYIYAFMLISYSEDYFTYYFRNFLKLVKKCKKARNPAGMPREYRRNAAGMPIGAAGMHRHWWECRRECRGIPGNAAGMPVPKCRECRGNAAFRHSCGIPGNAAAFLQHSRECRRECRGNAVSIGV